MTLRPFVFWAQTESDIFLKVDVKKVEGEPDVCIEEEEIEFTAKGIGSQGEGIVQTYHFVVEFFLPIDPSRSQVDVVEDKEIRICLKKKDADWWPRLLYEQRKVSWLKIDFDKWKTNDTDDSDNDEATKLLQDGISATDALRQKYPEVYKRLQKEELGFISESRRKIYLFCYNLFMFTGFLYVCFVMNIHYAKEGEEFIPKTYSYVGNAMKMLHLLMFLEILHPIFGYTKGSAKEAALQVVGRNFIIFVMIEAEVRMQEKPVVFYLFVIYITTELIRYPYYMQRTFDMDLGLITWYALRLRNKYWGVNSKISFFFKASLYSLDPALPGWLCLRRSNHATQHSLFRGNWTLHFCHAKFLELCLSLPNTVEGIPPFRILPRSLYDNELHVPAEMQAP